MSPESKAKAKFTGCVDKPTFILSLITMKMKFEEWTLVDFVTEVKIDYELEKYN